jgi:diguanylate cyclase (GGDEF)-like protein/PAS domain S-box-containing protein
MGTGVIAMAIYVSGAASSPVVLFYVWIAAYSAWFLPRAYTGIHVTWIGVSFLVVILVHHAAAHDGGWHLSASDVSRWLLLVGTVVATAFMVQTFRNTFLDHEQRFELAFERSATPMLLASLDRRLLRVNNAFCALVGRTPDELIGISFGEVIHDSVREPADTSSRASRGASGFPNAFETRLRTGDGSSIWVHVASSLVTDRRGQPVHHFAQLLDVTARREAEHKLRTRASRQAAIADISQAALKGADAIELSDQVVAVAAEHLGAELTAILEKNGSEDFHVVARREASADGWTSARDGVIAAGPGSLAALTLTSGEPTVVENWESETRCRRGTLEDGLPLRSALSVPVGGRKNPYGVLMAESSRSHAFTHDDQTFLRALANMLAEAIDERRAQEQIAHHALHDALTGLPNRVLFADLLRHALARARRDGGHLAVLLLDIDHFKLVNDSLGHGVGDRLLCEFAERLESTLRTQDTLARFSADEFVILCDDLDNERSAIRVADRVLAVFEPLFELDGEEIAISATAGIAIAGPEHTSEALIRDAEAAMHRAKERSRGRYELFDREMHARNVGRLRTENALRRAHDSRELYLAYQPLVTLATGETESYEALLRWEHPQWGQVSPVEFIPIAEESGLIIPIGRRVIADACAQLARWQADDELQPKPVAVNVSSRQLYDDALAYYIRQTLEETLLDPSLLTLELTETSVVTDTRHAQQVLHELKEIGVRLALDDFGTGYASLSYLSQFPFDVVKLDRTLIRGIGKSRKDDIIIASSIEMGHALGLTVVAEGIETADQALAVASLGCDLAQGYFYAVPAAAPSRAA